VRWAVIALQQSDRHLLGGERSLDLALTGRRASECELEILMLLEPGRELGLRPSERPSFALPEGAERQAMQDLPRGPALLAHARDVLVNDLLPLLPPDRRLDARLVANCMAIAEREAGPQEFLEAVRGELEALFGTGHVGNAPDLLRRFARELRIGGYENSAERSAPARAILWRLTIAKLRLANPRFLAANGLS
jgi:hypothetical protein